MTVINPPGFLQNAGATHTAEQFRNWFGLLLSGKQGATSLISRGGVNPTLGNALQVTQTGSPSMAVLVKSGHAMISGSEGSKQGVYAVMNDADVTLSISAAHASLNRIDSVVFKVEDSAYSGVTNTSSVVVVTGTPAGSPSAPALPNNSLELAQVSIVANDTSITTGEITDKRQYIGAIGGIIQALSTARPSNPVEGMAIYETDVDVFRIYDGTTWIETGNKSWSQAWDSYTPAWTSTGTAPALGNGTLTGFYKQVGKTVHVRIVLTLGSTSTVGTGTYRLSLPVAPKVGGMLLALFKDASAGSTRYSGTAELTLNTATGDNMRINVDSSTGTVGAAIPVVPANGDSITITGTFEAD